MTLQAVLFDLDGTLVDTAPDLVAVLNRLLREEGQRLMPYAIARNEVSNGALGLIRLGFGTDLAQSRCEALRARFLEIYQDSICNNSLLFSGIRDIFNALNDHGIRWGIVTNKPRAFTEPLLAMLALRPDHGCVVSGDSLPQRKPHPAPLLLAADMLDCPAEQCAYIGDALRDIEAGRAAGMITVAALWGYIRQGEAPADWGADIVIRRPADIRDMLRRWPAAARPRSGHSGVLMPATTYSGD